MVLRLSAESPGNRNFYLSGRVEEPISVPFELSNSGGKNIWIGVEKIVDRMPVMSEKGNSCRPTFGIMCNLPTFVTRQVLTMLVTDPEGMTAGQVP